ncbi:hypothetical protein ACFX1Q_000167 [Malus domestica]|uniref:Uncharacterized protein n=1 Tax=Malus domestica TaxID=3750 RepID=A0A498KMP7_MALDO|nr:hypothetical protein DVH24_034047 [Malus domestica]
MAAIPCKHLVVVAFFLLCFVSITAQGRSLGLVSKRAGDAYQKNEDDQAVVLQDEINDLLAMDYTPARKKPPIHN